MADSVLVERDGPVATVVLNRPESLNALSESSWRELGRGVRGLSLDPDLRCVILRGAGSKAFGAGADITEFPQVRSDAAEGRVYGELIHSTMQAIGECIHPPVAMIRAADGRLSPPADRDDQRRMRRRRARSRVDVRRSNLRRVEPLRYSDQPPRTHHGLRRIERAPVGGRSRRGARDPARGADLRRAGGA